MNNISEALIWITNILKKYNIPFQITGGLAAHSYGGKRAIEDIDIDIPDDKFDLIKEDVAPFITFGPERFKSDKWDLLLMTLNYNGQEIDLSGADSTKIYNEKSKEWIRLCENFNKAEIKELFGAKYSIISRDSLITYKKILSRDVDLIDIDEIDK